MLSLVRENIHKWVKNKFQNNSMFFSDIICLVSWLYLRRCLAYHRAEVTKYELWHSTTELLNMSAHIDHKGIIYKSMYELLSNKFVSNH
jgi:hypothetical protein